MSNNKILFDPGFAPYIVNFSSNVEEYKNILSSLATLNQKKSVYTSIHRKIFVLLKNNVSFYLGCLLWGYHLNKTYKESPQEIEGNSFYGLSSEKLQEYDYTYEINYILDYLHQYERDSKYYGVKTQPIPDEWTKILKIYKEFIELNNCFVDTKYTNDIIIPKNFACLDSKFEIYKEIRKSIQEKRIENLLELNIFAYRP